LCDLTGKVIFLTAGDCVSGAVNNSYVYDANGNLITASAGSYRSVSYTSFNLPDSQQGLQGPAGGAQYTWQYDENHQRIKETRVNAGGSRTTWMLHPDNAGGLSFESEQANGVTSNRHYLSVGGASIGVLVSTGALPTLSAGQTVPATLTGITLVKVEYWHKDHLGSLVATTDHAGAVTARYAYDPFGKRRTASGNYDASGALVIDWNGTSSGTDRGYTGHEHLDDVGIIHMNGRLFDPQLGRFMQGDPFIQNPANLQNYNRYGYCYNNPGSCTDATGQFFGLDDLFVYAIIAIWSAEKAGIIDARTARIFTSIAVGVEFAPGGAFTFGGSPIAQAAITGFASGVIATGNIQGGLQGAFTAGVFNGVGNLAGGGDFFAGVPAGATPLSEATGVALHGVAGCVTSVVGGSKCGPGALSAAFTKALAPTTGQLTDGSRLAGTAVSAVVGGTASVLGGGKFGNGAVTGAFSYLFNELSHGISKEQAGYEVRRGRLSYHEAVDQWQNGGGMDVRVPLLSLDLSQISAADFPLGVGSTVVVNLSGRMGTNLSDQLVYGNVTLKLVAPGVVEAGLGYDRYNFDIKPWTRETVYRNLATLVGSAENSIAATARNLTLSPGRAFFIQLDGQAKIGPR
jgi:RHS repeat-associated protein